MIRVVGPTLVRERSLADDNQRSNLKGKEWPLVLVFRSSDPCVLGWRVLQPLRRESAREGMRSGDRTGSKICMKKYERLTEGDRVRHADKVGSVILSRDDLVMIVWDDGTKSDGNPRKAWMIDKIES